ncbi:hypothetical protein Halru_3093 [Halovivax ruber XH-70]|uniref:DUF7130 domain-containing protein n=1 Tax=Halovivax ruber (strain DSM 18193 / JCM 13892 / XH-70) TaxID=797302 RepID=L0IFW6_HALRX|nr:hypothetical protein [Halovivax ruber]AGB17659.1 hypothetical protein Halru_3093 [Halovivax ruber XH-70]
MEDTGDVTTAGNDAVEDAPKIALGQTISDERGTVLGTVRGVDDDGFYVTTREGIDSLSVEHVRSGQAFGEAELMWRCTNCGEMGELSDGLPGTCPNCGTEKEDLMYWTED